jgi:hypothetical protein
MNFSCTEPLTTPIRLPSKSALLWVALPALAGLVRLSRHEIK